MIDGKHRLLCGDSTNKKDVQKLLNNRSGILGFTSPPYWTGMSYEYQKSVDEINSFIKAACQNYSLAIQKDESRIVINNWNRFHN